MENYIDTSVLVAAMVAGEAYHKECRSLILKETVGMYGHGLTETFSTLTGGRKAFRLPPSVAANLLEQHFAPRLTITSLTPSDILKAMAEAESRGVRGGGIFDFLHLVAAKKAKAAKFYTLNTAHFVAIHRAGDPQIAHP